MRVNNNRMFVLLGVAAATLGLGDAGRPSTAGNSNPSPPTEDTSISGSNAGGGFDSCSKQNDCTSITTTKLDSFDSSCSGSCAYKICITLELGDGGNNACSKSGTISHICVRGDDDAVVCSSPPDWTGGDGSLLDTGSTHCQTVEAGESATFVLKDGTGCLDSWTGTTDAGDYISCDPSTVKYCSGNGNVGKECVWVVDAPADCGAEPATSPPTLPPTTPPTSPPTTPPTTPPTAPPTTPPTAPLIDPAQTAPPTSPPTNPPTMDMPQNADIRIKKTVVLGTPDSCNPGKEHVESNQGAPITWIYEVTNVGDSCLDSVVVTDVETGYSETLVPFGKEMYPGTQYIRCHESEIDGSLTSDATVIGNPVYCENGADIPSLNDVTDSDPAGVSQIYNKNECTIDMTRTQLPDGSYTVEQTETCRQCDCPT